MYHKNLLFACLLLAACGGRTDSPPQSDDHPALLINDTVQARIDSTLRSVVRKGHVAGVSALIYEHDREVYYNAFGDADREAHQPMDRHTLVRIFSMTKPITGVALMQLYEQGLFQLDDSLAQYLPEYAHMQVCTGADEAGQPMLAPAHRAITIRDLTRHTAGFARAEDPVLGPLVRQAEVMNYHNTLAVMSKVLARLPLAFHPGEQWAYGICVDVQARLVEQLAGMPFEQYVQQHILTPLGMHETAYVPVDTARFAAVYVKDSVLTRVPDGEADAFNGQSWPLTPGGWGLTASIDDYMRFARMLLHEGTLDSVTILKPETVKLMATNHLADSVTERMWLPTKGQVGFGIDFAVRLRPPASASENNGAVGEFFWDGAASTLFWVDPKNQLTAVLFTQVFPFDNPLHKAFRDAVYGRPNVPEPPAPPMK